MLRKFSYVIALCLAFMPAAQASGWPDKPITVIVPFPAGGSVDVVMRLIATPLGEKLGQAVVVENVGGAGGSIGATRAANSQTDGCTLLAGSINDVVLQPLVNRQLRYDSKDFEPISLVYTSPLVLVARRDLPQGDIDAVVRKLRAAPESLNFGSPGQGTFQHVVMEDFQRRTQTRMLHVPYKGAAPLVNDVLGGQIDMAVMAPPAALPHLRQGRLRLLGVISLERMAAYPDLATINESQSVQGMEMTGWMGLLAPRGVPTDRLERVRAALADVMQRADVRARVAAMGMDPVSTFDSASFLQRIASDQKRMRGLTDNLQSLE